MKPGAIGWRIGAFLLGLVFQVVAQNQPGLPALYAARQVLNLTPQEARRGYPVRLQGIVTGVCKETALLFVQDSTAGIYIYFSPFDPSWRQSTLLEVEGVTDPGRFSRIILASKITSRGQGQMPGPKPVTLPEIVAGSLDSQWVEVTGRVSSQLMQQRYPQLELEQNGQKLKVMLLEAAMDWMGNLSNLTVRVAGTVICNYDSNQKPSGFSIAAQNLANVCLVDANPDQDWAAPAQPIAQLATHPLRGVSGLQVHVQGIATYTNPGKILFIQDATGGLKLHTPQVASVQPGQKIDAVGILASAPGPVALQQVFFKTEGLEQVPEPKAVSVEQLRPGIYAYQLVSLTAQLLKISSPEPEVTVLDLAADSQLIHAILRQSGELLKLPAASQVRITGIYDPQAAPSHPAILLRSPRDVVVTQYPGGWILTRIALLILATLGLLGLGILWLKSLRTGIRRETARLREREQALEARCQDLFENANDMIFNLDPTGLFTAVNQTAETLTGYRREELRSINILAVCCPESRDLMRQCLANAPGSARFYDEEITILAKDGRRLHLAVDLRPDYLDGQPAGFRGIARNMTQRKQAEEALQASASQLRQMLLQREELGRDLHDDIIQSLYAVGLGLEDSQYCLERDVPATRQRLKQACEILNLLIRKIRGFIGSLENGLISLPPRLSQNLNTILHLTDPAGKLRHNLDIDPEAMQKLDPQQSTQLTHIAREAASNALRHARAASVTISLHRLDGHLILKIRDDGCGLHTNSTPGYGLKNMAARAQSLGGKFVINSQPGHGVQISVTIPVAS